MKTCKTRLKSLNDKIKNNIQNNKVISICEGILEYADSIPDVNLSKITIEKLSDFKNIDIISEFISSEKRLLMLVDMGISESIDTLLKSKNVENNYAIKQSLTNLNVTLSYTDDYKIVESFLNIISPLTWDSNVKIEYDKILNKYNILQEEICIKSVIDYLSDDKFKFIYSNINEKLETYLYEKTKGVRKLLITELEKYNHNPYLLGLSNLLKNIDNRNNTKFNLINTDNSVKISNISGFAFVNESVDYLIIDNIIYKNTKYSINSLKENEFDKLDEDIKSFYIELQNPNVKIKNDSVVVTIDKNTNYKFIDQENIYENDKKISIDYIKNNFALSSVYGKNVMNNIKSALIIHKHMDKFVDIDFGSKLISNINESVFMNVFRKKDCFLLDFNNINKRDIKNYAKGKELRDYVYENIGYRLEDTFIDILEEHKRNLKILENNAKKSLDVIQMLNENIGKVQISINQNPIISNNANIINLLTELNEKLDLEKTKYNKILFDIRNLNVSEDQKIDIGYKVEVKNKGLGTVVSTISGTDNIHVLLNGGEDVFCNETDVKVISRGDDDIIDNNNLNDNEIENTEIKITEDENEDFIELNSSEETENNDSDDIDGVGDYNFYFDSNSKEDKIKMKDYENNDSDADMQTEPLSIENTDNNTKNNNIENDISSNNNTDTVTDKDQNPEIESEIKDEDGGFIDNDNNFDDEDLTPQAMVDNTDSNEIKQPTSQDNNIADESPDEIQSPNNDISPSNSEDINNSEKESNQTTNNDAEKDNIKDDDNEEDSNEKESTNESYNYEEDDYEEENEDDEDDDEDDDNEEDDNDLENLYESILSFDKFKSYKYKK